MPITSRFAAAAARGYGLFKVAAAAAKDAYFNYVTLLLPGNGTNGAQNNTFLDSSSNAFTITRNGNTTQGTFTPFSQTGWGNYFDGSGDYLTSSIGSISSGASFTFEFWAYFTGSLTANVRYFDLNSYAFAAQNLVYRVSGVSTGTGAVQVSMNGSQGASVNNVAKTNSWQHHAISYDGTTLSIWVDGTRVISYTPTAGGLLTSIALGSSAAAAEYFTGYISNFRLVIGSTVYTPSSTTITVPTTPLTAISGTSLLTCQANRFLDASSNAYTITRNGDVSVQPFSPFNPTSAWSASSNGGSGYFDGSGDYLSVAGNAALRPGTGDFTLEGWFYLTDFTGDKYLINQNFNDANASFANFLIFVTGTTGAIKYFSSTTGSSWNNVSGLSIGTAGLNQWFHVAVSRLSGTTRTFLNGVQQASQADSGNLNNTGGIYVGTYAPAAANLAGYMSNVRLLVGTGYSSITVPTAPLTAITNTQLLLSCTNGGITDSTAKNDLETVGNAQISTTQSKFGGSSMAFDGTDDRLVPAGNQNFAFGTGDFTVEAWVWTANVSNSGAGSQAGWIQTSDTAGGLKTTYTTGIMSWFGATTNGTVAANVGGTNYISAGSLVSTNTWYHIAITRYNGTVNVWLNGVSVASGTGNTSNLTGQYICVGGYYSTAYLLNGYIDDLRITKGVARYTANFTAPTAAFPLQ